MCKEALAYHIASGLILHAKVNSHCLVPCDTRSMWLMSAREASGIILPNCQKYMHTFCLQSCPKNARLQLVKYASRLTDTAFQKQHQKRSRTRTLDLFNIFEDKNERLHRAGFSNSG